MSREMFREDRSLSVEHGYRIHLCMHEVMDHSRMMHRVPRLHIEVARGPQYWVEVVMQP